MRIDILGVKIDNLSFDQVLDKVEQFLKDGKKHYIVTPNPEMVVLAQKDSQFRQILNSADLAIPDGIGLVWASRLLRGKEKKGIRERVRGVDFADKLCQIAAKKGAAVGFLGGKDKVADKAAKCQIAKYPGLKVVFALGSDPEKAAIDIKKVDILFVAYGAPKQEFWISQNLPKLPVKIAIGVGGVFDYWADKVKRAPKWLQNLGLEWLWRLILQPWRIKRQLALLIFVYLVIKQRLSLKLTVLT